MLFFVKMLGRVLVFRRIAASHVTTRQAQPQVNPSVPGLHTLFADMLARLFDLDLIQMRTFTGHGFLLNDLALRSSDLSHVTKDHNHIKSLPLSLTILLGGFSFVFRPEYLRLDYLSCVLTVASTILVGRRCWEGWALAGVNSIIICVIGLRTEQFGFIPANVFCMVISAINLRAWRKT